MKVFFISSTGHCYLDEVNPKFRFIECKDGYHVISNDAIWKSGDRDEEAVVFIWQGRSSPEGQDPKRVRFALKETNRLKDNRQKIMVSRLWVRHAKTIIKAFVWFLVAFFTIYIVYLVNEASRLSG